MPDALIKVGSFLAAVVGWTLKWIADNKDKIQAIVVRIEKDSKDGWTNEEKEDLAVDLFFQEIYPQMPSIIRIFPRAWVEKWVREVIRGICKKSHELKDKLIKK